MEQHIFYTTDYYRILNNLEKERVFKILDSSTDLINEAKSVMAILRDELYSMLIPDNSIRTSSLYDQDFDKIDLLTKVLLEHDPALISAQDQNTSSNLFTIPFKKVLDKIFKRDGLNDLKDLILEHVENWIEGKLAEAISEDERFKGPGTLIKVLSKNELLDNFYWPLVNSIPQIWVNENIEEWTSINEPPENLLDHIRTFDKEYFQAYQQILNKEYPNSWEKFYETTRFSDHGMLNENISFKSSVILKNDIDAFILLLDNLNLPILQNMLFSYGMSVNQIISIAEHLIKASDIKSEKTLLAYILLEGLVHSIGHTDEKLATYLDDNFIESMSHHQKNEHLISLGKMAADAWQAERKSSIQNILKLLKQILSISEIEKWVFRHVTQDGKSVRDSQHNSLVDNIRNEFKILITPLLPKDQSDFIADGFSLQKFDFLINDSGLTFSNEDIEALLSHLKKLIEQTDFFWPNNFKSPYWKYLNAFGILLSLTIRPVDYAKEFIAEYLIVKEGWLAKYIDGNASYKETFVLCGSILLLEHDEAFSSESERQHYFKFILSLIIKQMRFTNHDLGNYMIPMVLLQLIAEQFLESEKEYFYEQTFSQLDDIVEVSRLYIGAKEISKTNLDLLDKRVEREIPLKKRLFDQKKQKELGTILLKAIDKLEKESAKFN